MKNRFIIIICCLVVLLQLLPIVPLADTTGAVTVEKVKKVSQDLYYCRTELYKMPNGEKLVDVYDRIVDGIENCATEIEIGLSEEQFKLVLDATRRDHTEQFWMGSGYSMVPSVHDETFIEIMKPTYTMSGAELEDAIEQGYIKILPVKAGDKIYVVPSKVNFDLNKLNGYSEHNRVYEQTVDEIRFFRKDIYMVFSCDYLENHRGASLGETWFLTREEAEKRLKELQE